MSQLQMSLSFGFSSITMWGSLQWPLGWQTTFYHFVLKHKLPSQLSPVVHLSNIVFLTVANVRCLEKQNKKNKQSKNQCNINFHVFWHSLL